MLNLFTDYSCYLSYKIRKQKFSHIVKLNKLVFTKIEETLKSNIVIPIMFSVSIIPWTCNCRPKFKKACAMVPIRN